MLVSAWIIDLVTGRYLVQLVRQFCNVLTLALKNLWANTSSFKLRGWLCDLAFCEWPGGRGLPATASFAYGFKLLTLHDRSTLCHSRRISTCGGAHYNRLNFPKNSHQKLSSGRSSYRFIIAAILSIATILDKSPVALFTAFGAATGVLLFVFKDSILGFVTSIQLASFDMIRIGDWVAMPSFGADGNVIEISLTTVKIRNFDKTVTTIPTYALLSNGVKNWRGMTESGGRRIKQAVNIDAKSVRFCDAEILTVSEACAVARLSEIDSLRSKPAR